MGTEACAEGSISVPDIDEMVRPQASGIRMAMGVCVRSDRSVLQPKETEYAADNARILTAGGHSHDHQPR